jgi:hypothetical protein
MGLQGRLAAAIGITAPANGLIRLPGPPGGRFRAIGSRCGGPGRGRSAGNRPICQVMYGGSRTTPPRTFWLGSPISSQNRLKPLLNLEKNVVQMPFFDFEMPIAPQILGIFPPEIVKTASETPFQARTRSVSYKNSFPGQPRRGSLS